MDKKATRIPCIELEKEYAKKIINKKQCWQPLRMALGTLLIQKNSASVLKRALCKFKKILIFSPSFDEITQFVN